MTCVYRGRLSVLFSLLVVALCVTCLLPRVFWLRHTETDVTPTSNTTSTTVEVVTRESLWVTCNTTTISFSADSPSIVTEHCSKAKPYSLFNITNYKTEKSGEQKGTIAGLILGGLLALIAMFTALCEHKGATIGILFFAFVFVGASVGAFARYKTHFLGTSVDFFIGFYLCAVTFLMVLFSCFGAFVMNKHRVAYHEFA